MEDRVNEYILPSTEEESARLEKQAELYDGIGIIEPFLTAQPKSVLDIGCGTGFFTRFCAKTLPSSRVVGVDQDEHRLSLARNRKEKPTNLQYTSADFHKLPFADDSFDLTFSRFVLVHAIDPSLAIREMKRVTAPGGQVVTYDMVHDGIWFSPDKPAFRSVLKLVIETMRGLGMEPNQGLHLGTAMMGVGFKEIDVRVLPHYMMATDKLFERYRQNWIETISNLEGILGSDLDNDLVDQALAELKDMRPQQSLVELTVLAAGIK